MEDTQTVEPPVARRPVERLVSPFYDRDGITIYNADCREVLPLLDDVAVMVTDPPFGINHSSGREGKYKDVVIANDETTEARDDILRVWGDRPALVFGSWRHPLHQAKQAIVWDKGDASGMGDLSIPWKPNWELIFVLGCGFEGRRTTGVISGPTVVTWASRGRCHPNMKPVGLMKMLLDKCPQGRVVDPFMGSGTTLVAAKHLGMRAVGIEVSAEYCEVAVERLRQGVLDFGSEG